MDNLFDNSQVRELTIMKPEPRKEGCELVEIKMNDDKSVSFTFVDAKKNSLTQRYFMPTRRETDSDDDFKKSISLTISGIAHIARAYLTQEEFDAIKVDDGGNIAKIQTNWVEYVTKTGKALSGKYKNVKCALKVVYRKSKDKYYSSLPQVPPFISTENHPKDFVTNPTYDLYEIPSRGASSATAFDRELPNQDLGAETAQAPGTNW